MRAPARCRTAPEVQRQAAARGELAAPLAQVREAQDRFGEVVVGGELQRVDAGALEGAANVVLALPGGLRVALAEGTVAGVDEELLAGLGVLHQHQPDVGQLHLDRVEAAAPRSPRGAAQDGRATRPSPAC